MILLKIYWRTKAAIKKLCFKIMFGKRFSVGKNTTFRKNFGLYLEKGASIKIGHDCFFNRAVLLIASKVSKSAIIPFSEKMLKFMTRIINSGTELSLSVNRDIQQVV